MNDNALSEHIGLFRCLGLTTSLSFEQSDGLGLFHSIVLSDSYSAIE